MGKHTFDDHRVAEVAMTERMPTAEMLILRKEEVPS